MSDVSFLLCLSLFILLKDNLQIHHQELELLYLLPGVASADLAVGHGAVLGCSQVVERSEMPRFLWQGQGGGARTRLLMKSHRRTDVKVPLRFLVHLELPVVRHLEFSNRHLLWDCSLHRAFLIRNIKRLEVCCRCVWRGFALLRC